MNQRIEELKKQAMIRVNTPTVNSDGKVICDNWEEGISLSKFAELVVRECIEVCKSRVGNSDYNTGRMHCASDLKEHFGVEL